MTTKIRTPESREADAKKILESRPQREHTPKGQLRVMPVVLSPTERQKKPVVAETATTESAEPAEVVIESKPKKRKLAKED